MPIDTGTHKDFDDGNGTVERRVFADAAVYRREMATLFDRAWLFVAPLNWLVVPGDFVTARMGEDPVLAWRRPTGDVAAFVNRCSVGYREVAVGPRGRDLVLRCPCHNLPFSAEADTARTLEPIARLASHRGLLFANRDAQAEPFDQWLGDFGWYLDLFLPPEGVEVHGEERFASVVAANWKLPILSGAGDLGDMPGKQDQVPVGHQIYLGNGSALVLDRDLADAADPRTGFTPLAALLYPNLLIDCERHSLTVIHPLSAMRSEMHNYCIVPAVATPPDRFAAQREFQRAMSPGSAEMSHRVEQWRSISAGARSGRHRRQQLSVASGLGKERVTNLPGAFATLTSEANQRAFLAWWQEQILQPQRAVPSLLRFR